MTKHGGKPAGFPKLSPIREQHFNQLHLSDDEINDCADGKRIVKMSRKHLDSCESCQVRLQRACESPLNEDD